jgi:hypothetical protein
MNKPSEKSFGILFFFVFLLISVWPFFSEGNTIRYWALSISIIFLALALFKKELLKPLNIVWIKFGELLGRIIAPMVMALIYFSILTPLSIIIRIFGKDLLRLKTSKENSYWIKREKNINSMDKQF